MNKNLPQNRSAAPQWWSRLRFRWLRSVPLWLLSALRIPDRVAVVGIVPGVPVLRTGFLGAGLRVPEPELDTVCSDSAIRRIVADEPGTGSHQISAVDFPEHRTAGLPAMDSLVDRKSYPPVFRGVRKPDHRASSPMVDTVLELLGQPLDEQSSIFSADRQVLPRKPEPRRRL